jgi:hypothetical protein
VFADVALMVLAFLAIGKIGSGGGRIALGVVLVIAAGIYSITYERGFVGDSTMRNTRMKAAGIIDSMPAEDKTLYVSAEPAPYCLPPVNLFRWRMILLPVGGAVPAGSSSGVLVKPKDSFEVWDPGATPISWAGKAFDVVMISGK